MDWPFCYSSVGHFSFTCIYLQFSTGKWAFLFRQFRMYRVRVCDNRDERRFRSSCRLFQLNIAKLSVIWLTITINIVIIVVFYIILMYSL